MEIQNEKQSLLKPYKLPRLYTAKGDLKAQWFVYFSYLHPVSGKFERIKVYEKLNTFKTKGERLEYGALLVSQWTTMLKAGYNPFQEVGEQLHSSVSTIKEAIVAYLSDKQAQVRKKTVMGYRSILKQFQAWAERRGVLHLPMRQVTPEHVQAYLTEARKVRGIAATTHNSELATLRSFFNHFSKLCVMNPAEKIKRLREEIELHTIYNDADVEKITSHIKGLDTPRSRQLLQYIRFLYYTCIRPKELASLKIGDIRFDTHTIIIPAKVSKVGRSEPVDVSPALLEIITEMGLRGMPPDYYIFGNQGSGKFGDYVLPEPGPKPVGPNYFSKYYREFMDELGYNENYTLYGWKHTRNVHLYMQSGDLLRIMRHNRHTDPKVTMRYLRSLGLLMDHRITEERRI